MHITTFYSFKGGVGRTLALANVALQLAKTGRRVLCIDFDLEAPGLNTFDRFRPKEAKAGLVDYICQFIKTKESPDVKDFVYEVSSEGQNGGRLWIMSAGLADSDYSSKLHSIDWHLLYKHFNGYLMFEDMKAQWDACFQPDYVLIDSRTGHTDVGGICTRQLPNAVVLLFFPNKQNLAGLQAVVSSIKDEDKKLNKSTQLHFVMSNVPDLDDENEILANIECDFRRELGYLELDAIIHRYDSLSLLNQSLFVAERPNSRLAREYTKLTENITQGNFQDREAVIQKLKTDSPFDFSLEKDPKQEKVREMIDKTLKFHPNNAEIIYLLSKFSKTRGLLKVSEILLEKSLELGYSSSEALLQKVSTKLQQMKPTSVARDILRAFQSKEVAVDDLRLGIEMLRKTDSSKLVELTETAAFQCLTASQAMQLSEELNWCRPGLEATIKLLSKYYSDPNLSVSMKDSLKNSLLLAYIGISKFKDAMKLLGSVRPGPADLSLEHSFNYGMAEWGDSHIAPKDMFERVISLDTKEMRGDANYLQCLAIAFWVIGEVDTARSHLDKAEKQAAKMLVPTFSCWRYTQVIPKEFAEDCDSIRNLFDGQKITPVFFEQNSKSG